MLRRNTALHLLLIPLAVLCAQCSSDDSATGPGQTGSDTSVSATIGAEGGEVWLRGDAWVVIPANALDVSTTITISDAGAVPDLSGNHVSIGPPFSFEPHGQLFNVPVEINITYEPDTLAVGVSVERLDSDVDPTWAPVPVPVFDEGIATFNSTTFSIVCTTRLQQLDTIYVSTGSRGLDADGSRNDPLPSITAGMAASLAVGEPYPPVMVAVGEYHEAIGFTDGISIQGGFDATRWVAEEGARSTVRLGTSTAVAENIRELTGISGLALVADDATVASDNSVALRIINCSEKLVFTNCLFQAGNAAVGARGDAGAKGRDGGNGGWAGTGYNDHYMDGGPGGKGTYYAGGDGADATYTGSALAQDWGRSGEGRLACFGLGGTPGAALPAGDGWEGGPGWIGAHGSGGTNEQFGSIQGWVAVDAPDDATGGAPGCGGGGGGGGWKWLEGGRGGGGGGAGGNGGFAGHGGGGGGSSFALYLWESAPVFDKCVFISGSGGAGGVGGNGGAGGAGGSGGGSVGGENEYVNGGNGGKGGHGGPGGSGGGGAGGHSFCVYRLGTICEFADFSGCREQDWHPGAAGLGAPGGSGAESRRGADGQSARIGPEVLSEQQKGGTR